jgi:hypothetical protein
MNLKYKDRHNVTELSTTMKLTLDDEVQALHMLSFLPAS